MVLTGYPTQPALPAFYYTADGVNTQFTVQAGGDACEEPAAVDYHVSPATADASDFAPASNRLNFHVPVHSFDERTVPVTVHGDDVVESLEHAQISLSNPFNAALGTPSSAPLFILDDDGASRVGVGVASHAHSETFFQTPIRVPVFRLGNAGAPHVVSYTVTPSGPNPATPEADYHGGSGTLTFGAGERLKTIDLTVVNDSTVESPEDVTVTVQGGIPASTVVTILDNEEGEPPSSRFHHPRNGWRYRKSDYRIREVHVFSGDNPGGAGVVGNQFALRRNKRNGSCQWFSPGGWQARECSNRLWLDMGFDPVGELFRYRLPQLKSSVGTPIKNYTAFSRAIDGAGNVESTFNTGRNDNTFEVKRRRRR
jgi:hypothetical protein